MFKRIFTLLFVMWMLVYFPQRLAVQRAYEEMESYLNNFQATNHWLQVTNSALEALPPIVGQRPISSIRFQDTNLSSLPDSIANAHIGEVKLYVNSMNLLADDLHKLPHLQSLTILDYDGTTLPAELFQATGITHLFIRGSNLTSLPAEIGNLRNLQMLTILAGLTALPAEFAQLQNLNEIRFEYTQFEVFPLELTELPNLTRLSLSDDKTITTLPAEIGNMSGLQSLWLNNTSITSLPVEIGNVPLTSLSLDNTPISALPDVKFEELGYLNLTGTNISYANYLDYRNVFAKQGCRINYYPSKAEMMDLIVNHRADPDNFSSGYMIGSNYYFDFSELGLTEIPTLGTYLFRGTHLDVSNNPITELSPELINYFNTYDNWLQVDPYAIFPQMNLDNTLITELPEGATTSQFSIENTPLSYTISARVYGSLFLMVGLVTSLGWWFGRKLWISRVEMVREYSPTKNKGSRITVYHVRWLLWLIASGVCAFPFFMYIAVNPYYFTETEARIFPLIAIYLVAYVFTLYATWRMTQQVLQEQDIYSDVRANKFQAWKTAFSRTWFWHALMIVPRFGLAIGATQLFYTHFSPYCGTADHFKYWLMPYCYSLDSSQYFPMTGQVIVAITLLLVFALLECGIVVALACTVKSFVRLLLRRVVLFVVMSIFICTYMLIPISQKFAFSLWSNELGNPVEWVKINYGIYDIEDFYDTNGLDVWLMGVQQVMTNTLDSGILLSTDMMKSSATNWGWVGEQNQHSFTLIVIALTISLSGAWLAFLVWRLRRA
jgi:Leucine-rich repeat (LRR) protein